MSTGCIAYTVVVPTTGRASLGALLAALETTPAPQEIVVVDDRPGADAALPVPSGTVPTRVVLSGGRGPAGARNVGWQQATTPWVVFLDDDVVPAAGWSRALQRDLAEVDEETAGCQGKIVVPLPHDRAPTDLERGTAGLAQAWWITADMAYRRDVLALLGGFDEEFPRAYREDADLALRVRMLGYQLTSGSRNTFHPVRADGFFASVRAQAGNADNAVMRRKYGRNWRRRAGEGPGRIGRHAATTAAALVSTAGAGRPTWRPVAAAGAAVWLALTAEFAWRRIAPGPRTPMETARMLVTSALIPPVACWHRARGEWRSRSGRKRGRHGAPAAVLFDRDDTLIHDVPYNGDPRRVRPIAGVREALETLRNRGIAIGVVSNQSGVARGLIDEHQLRTVNDEVERHLGPFGTWQVCVHGEDDGCACRKPAPGLITRAARALGVPAGSCVVIGDTGADVQAAIAAGARAILVPTHRTLPEEVRSADRVAEVAQTVTYAVRRVLEEVPR
ncbi:HAD superfamily hydrolase (TIGR01509 family) [Halopolyspora algeriensis]|uniref:D,D-heptose 1,7-bisphosphate phosphatase n=1 Tax=Halopolyspora algeriensis TaxID=1500506 RepID=A0A368VYG9_9ACTN|nr:HAD-IIIA family hydrolase [Halopolyspora algeriensis]RCW44624.1 HAD superfamily hydrolase (TIGR01509 family) [Halopolyspora algeriensis]TQM55985.1 HAD superfamily hydrolase (TIGR01509 family) [Halopolyspora algeriensis]